MYFCPAMHYLQSFAVCVKLLTRRWETEVEKKEEDVVREGLP